MQRHENQPGGEDQPWRWTRTDRSWLRWVSGVKPLPWLRLEQPHAEPAMARFDSPHFLLEQLEDGWMLEATHVTKDADGDWMLDHDELVELQALLQQALG